jgi:urease accessory protein UreH
VLVAIVTVLGHRTHTEAVLMQGRASDEWNEYQAKKIRMESLLVVMDQMALQPTVDAKASAAKLTEYKAHIAKWTVDLKEEQDTANEYQNEVKLAEAKAVRFDLGEALLEISVVLSSITLLTRRRTFFFGGLALGVVGLVIAVSALMVR